MKLKLTLAAALAAVSLLPARSEAGLNYGTYRPNCARYADGSGYCQGTFASFRANADTQAYADISGSTTGLGPYFASFNAELNGVQYSCTTQTAEVIAAMIDLSRSAHVFYIAWDTTGTCYFVQSSGLSQNPN